MKYIPDDRTDFHWERNPRNSVIVDIKHRSADDWRIYSDTAVNAGDSMINTRRTDAALSRGASVYVRKGTLRVDGMHSLFPADSPHRPAAVRSTSEGRFLSSSVGNTISKAVLADDAIITDSRRDTVSVGVEAGTEWWCIITPHHQYHSSSTAAHVLPAMRRRMNTLRSEDNFQLVFFDASITLDGSSYAGELVVVRHMADEPVVPIVIHRADLLLAVEFSSPPPASKGKGRQELIKR